MTEKILKFQNKKFYRRSFAGRKRELENPACVYLDKVVQCAGYRGRVAGATNLTLDCPVEQLFRRYYSRLALLSLLPERHTRDDSLLNRGENGISDCLYQLRDVGDGYRRAARPENDT